MPEQRARQDRIFRMITEKINAGVRSGAPARRSAGDRLLPDRRSTPGTGIGVTASFGVAERSSGELLDALLQRVDRALYTAKKPSPDKS
jgi:GGDEF domain-containing protein